MESCVSHHFPLIRFISLNSALYSRGYSIAGRNVLFCTHRFRCTVQDILNGSVDNLINSSVERSIDDRMRSHANILLELLMLRDGTSAGIVKFALVQCG